MDALISQIYFWNKTTCFRQFLCPSSGVLHYTHSNGICHISLLSANPYDIAMCAVKRTPDDGQRNCPKHVEFYYKNKFERLIYVVSFIVRVDHDARSSERQI